MGVDSDMLIFLADCKSSGASFTNMLSIGRQQRIFPLNIAKKVLQYIDCFDDDLFKKMSDSKSISYADELFQMLGANKLDCLDYSNFEGANVIHDLNQPLPDTLKGQYDLVFDGGTIEHIFHCQEALRSYMNLCKVGGSVIITAPANNWMGHGFYQLSPDFYYRALSSANGFEIRRMILTALGPFKKWYEVSDPKNIGERIELISIARQMVILVHAVKIKDTNIFSSAPQQQSYENDDYASMKDALSINKAKKSVFEKLTSHFPAISRILHLFRTIYAFYTTYTTLNRRFFKPVPRWPDPSYSKSFVKK